jgi:hypothetical protein
MPRTGSRQDFDNFDGWETFDIEEELYANAERDLIDDWEDDGAIAEVREPEVKEEANQAQEGQETAKNSSNC